MRSLKANPNHASDSGNLLHVDTAPLHVPLTVHAISTTHSNCYTRPASCRALNLCALIKAGCEPARLRACGQQGPAVDPDSRDAARRARRPHHVGP